MLSEYFRLKLCIILLFFSFSSQAQYKYKSSYYNGFYVEVGGLSRGLSINYNYIPYRSHKGFVSTSIGAAYVYGYATVSGEPNPWGFQNSGLGIPVSAMYNHSIGSIDKNVFDALAKKCIQRPARFPMDLFLETGLGASPTFFNKSSLEKNRMVYFGYLGLRSQIKVNRPNHDTDLVFFVRGGASPFYDKKSFNFSQMGSFGGSFGFGF